MEINLPIEEMRKKKLMVCTPMYGGDAGGIFTRSMVDLAAICAANGIQLLVYFLFNESLIPRARNYCVDEFMRSGADHMIFIDADIGFTPIDVLALMALQLLEPDKYDIIGAAYPKKTISWEKIKLAVDKGMADKDPEMLSQFVGDYVFNPKGGQQNIQIGEPCEVLEIGTGFMMVTRNAFVKYQEFYPQFMYKPDHVRTVHFDGSREIMMFFQAEIDPASRRYLSEDYAFCQYAKKAGLKIWLCPWIQLNHKGAYIFGGSLAAIASIGAAATADPTKLGGKGNNLQANIIKKEPLLEITPKEK